VHVPLLAALPASASGGVGGSRRGSGRTQPTSGPRIGRGERPTGSGPTGAGPTGGPPTSGGPTSSSPTGGGTPGGGNPPGDATTPTPTAPPPTSTSPPTPLQHVGGGVEQIAAPLPEPVRSTAGQIVNPVTDAAGRVLGRR